MLYRRLLITILSGVLVNAHVAVWHPSMWCFNGADPGKVDESATEATRPLMKMDHKDWFLHQSDCRNAPPEPGQFLDIPANKQFTVELAVNRAFTSWSRGGRDVTDFVDGKKIYNNLDNWTLNPPACLTDPNLHAARKSDAAGTAFAISYQSDINQVLPENLVVFSVRYFTPWLNRLVTYDVPDLPACPEKGCICAWGWVPNGCGDPNMYHFPYRCRVTGATSKKSVAPAKPPTWCEGEPSACTTGARQMIAWHQLNWNNIEVSGEDREGKPKSPAYNMKCGFKDGAQKDIFGDSSESGSALSNKTSADNPTPDDPFPATFNNTSSTNDPSPDNLFPVTSNNESTGDSTSENPSPSQKSSRVGAGHHKLRRRVWDW